MTAAALGDSNGTGSVGDSSIRPTGIPNLGEPIAQPGKVWIYVPALNSPLTERLGHGGADQVLGDGGRVDSRETVNDRLLALWARRRGEGEPEAGQKPRGSLPLARTKRNIAGCYFALLERLARSTSNRRSRGRLLARRLGRLLGRRLSHGGCLRAPPGLIGCWPLRRSCGGLLDNLELRHPGRCRWRGRDWCLLHQKEPRSMHCKAQCQRDEQSVRGPGTPGAGRVFFG